MQNLVLAKRPTRLLAFLAITPRWPQLLALLVLLLSSAGVRAQVTGYTQFSVTPDGFLKFGSPAAASQFTNALASATHIPKLAVYWDDLTTGTTAAGGNIRYLFAGTAPAGPPPGWSCLSPCACHRAAALALR